MLGIEWDGRRWPIKGAAERSGRRRCCFGKFTSPYPSLPTCVTHFFQYDSWNPIGKTCAIDSASISSWEKRIVASFNYHIFWPINITVTGISLTLEKLILTPSIPPPPLFLIVFFWVSSMFELFRECAAALNGRHSNLFEAQRGFYWRRVYIFRPHSDGTQGGGRKGTAGKGGLQLREEEEEEEEEDQRLWV